VPRRSSGGSLDRRSFFCDIQISRDEMDTR
jgi:hypothetical protein